MTPLPKACSCVGHEGPHELATRDSAKASRLAMLAGLRSDPGATRAAHEQSAIVALSIAADGARDAAEHARWMYRLGLAAFCRGCWQGFAPADLPTTCGCGREHPAQPHVDLLALAARLDVLGQWPPQPDAALRALVPAEGARS